jgi:phosphate transport system permease protein
MASIAPTQNSDQSAAQGMDRSFARPQTLMDLVWTGIAFTLLGIALLPLLLVLGYVIFKGIGRFNLDLFTQQIPAALQPGGGVGSAIAGTLLTVAIATLISVPLSILAAVYLSEFSSKNIASWIRFATNVLSGVPSIIVGIFAYGMFVVTIGKFSAVAGGVALAILMLPLIVRSTDEALQLVPQDVRWASAVVGASQFQTVLQVILPAALPTILTGITLAIARAAGETAPLIFTTLFSQFWPRGLFEPIPTLAVLIYNFATVPFQNQQAIAWAASLLLVLLVLLSSLFARWITRKSFYSQSQ